MVCFRSLKALIENLWAFNTISCADATNTIKMYQTQKRVRIQKRTKKYNKLAINSICTLYTLFLWKFFVWPEICESAPGKRAGLVGILINGNLFFTKLKNINFWWRKTVEIFFQKVIFLSFCEPFWPQNGEIGFFKKNPALSGFMNASSS